MTEFYLNIWKGTFSGTSEELSQLLSRAEDIVNNAIYLSGYTVETAPEIMKENVMKAVCAQADFIEEGGGTAALTEFPVSSVTLGKFSYSAASGGDAEESSASLCSLARCYLVPTGLFYKGVSAL